MIKTNQWVTKWGSIITGVYRDGKSDWNTNQAILKEDEYFFNRLPLSREGVAIDIGSFVGSAALALASLGIKVVAVEALSKNVECIKKAMSLNSFGGQITLYHRAIGDSDTSTIKIYHGDTSNATGDVHEFVGNAFATPGLHALPEEVQTISLDTIFQENKISHCPVLKIDCEGGEWACFKAASPETLDKIDYIVGELHDVGLPGCNTRKDFLDLFKGKFEDISAQYGLNLASSGAQGLTSFVLKRK